jgi:dihydrofolate synthase/folylpolyglutamate synthase
VSPRDYLFSLEQIGIKLGLAQIRALLAALDRPDRAYPSIVIAGTNGKGSVTAMVERGLRAAGYRTGRYTSPHLVHLEERVAINGESMAAAELERIAERVRVAAASLPAPPSFFEATTALALEAFREARVEIAVLEVGLGGRLDATNAVDSIGVAITAVDFDHEAYLGHTLKAIAGEKAGVIKPDGIVVLGENPPVVRDVVKSVAQEQHARLTYAPEGTAFSAQMIDGATVLSLRTPHADYVNVRLGLRGRHQIANAIVAVRLLEQLAADAPLRVDASHIRTALESVTWPGRLELCRWRGHDILIDGAHNPAGARALAAYVQETYGRRLPIVIGAMSDKHIDAMLAALAPMASRFVCTAVDSPRAAPAADIAGVAREILGRSDDAAARGVAVEAIVPPMAALEAAIATGNPVVVAGSLYLAGELRAQLS